MPALRKLVSDPSPNLRSGFFICPMAETINRAIHDKNNPYTRVTNRLARDTRLSYEARGLMLYLLSHNNSWKIRIADIMKQGGIGRDKARAILRELATFGYITRPKNGLDGKFDWEIKVYEDPTENVQTPVEPSPENPSMVESPSPENPPLRNNKENELLERECIKKKQPHPLTPGNDLTNPNDDFDEQPFPGLRPKTKTPAKEQLKPKFNPVEKKLIQICGIYPHTITPFQFNEVQSVAAVLATVPHFKVDWLDEFPECWRFHLNKNSPLNRASYVQEHYGAFLNWLVNNKGIDINEK